MNIEIAVIMVLSGLNIFFMFAYARELRRRDDFKEFMENWLERTKFRKDEFLDNGWEYIPEWIEVEVETLECLLKEFNK